MNRAQRRASKANGRRMMKKGWNEWEDKTAEAKRRGYPVDGMLKFFLNNLYSVQVFEHESSWGIITHLLVRRNDEGPFHSWSDMQRIKDEIAGSDRTAIEVYPEVHNLVDQANNYHLWVLPKGFNLPFGLHLWGKMLNFYASARTDVVILALRLIEACHYLRTNGLEHLADALEKEP